MDLISVISACPFDLPIDRWTINADGHAPETGQSTRGCASTPLVNAIARAHRSHRLLESGECGSITERVAADGARKVILVERLVDPAGARAGGDEEGQAAAGG